MSETRKCTKCRRTKPLTTEFFRLDSNQANGFRARCAACLRLAEERERERGFPRLPARPLALAIDRSDHRRRCEFFGGFTHGYAGRASTSEFTPECDTLGLSAQETPKVRHGKRQLFESVERMVYGWRTGERPLVNFDTVDAVLTNGRWLWWEVYNEQTVRKSVLTVTVRRRVVKKGRASYENRLRTPYGDDGPDHEMLAMVEHTFTCEGEGFCWICWAGKQSEARKERQLELAEAA